MFIKNDIIYCTVDEEWTISFSQKNYFTKSSHVQIDLNYLTNTIAMYEVLQDVLTQIDPSQELSVVSAEYDVATGNINVTVSFDTAGAYHIYIVDEYTRNVYKDYDVRVLPELTIPSMIFHEITDTETLNRLLTGINYTFEAYLTVTGGDETKYVDLGKNYRVGVFNDELDTTSQTTIINDLLEKSSFSDQPSEINIANRCAADFTYDEDYPLIVIIMGDYPQGYPNDFTVSFKDLKIYEKTNNLIGMQTHHIYPIRNAITDDSNSSITLDEFQNSNTFTLSSFYQDGESPEDEDVTYGNNETEAVNGIEIHLDIISCGNVTLLATLTNDKTSIGQRSIILTPIEETETPTTITIGGDTDSWGFNVGDIENLEDWELTLQILNNTSNENSITFNNIRMEYNTVTLEENPYPVYIEDTNLGYYSLFINDLDIPTGLKTDIKQLDIEGSDINKVTLQNIREKTIKITFQILGCDLIDSLKTLNKVAQLIYNERDIRTNEPIPKTLRTDLHPNKEWDYICTKEIEHTYVAGGLECSVELLVPDGTYRSTEKITTGIVGYNAGLTKISPEIILTNFKDSEITITENVSNQKFIIRDLVYSKNDRIVLDCLNRTITQSNPDNDEETDLTSNCDMDNDWFTINKNYNFNASNATITEISYYERG